MKTFNYEGMQIRYTESGSGAPLLFLHNGGTSHRIWQHQLPVFAERFRTFALDLPGYGSSGELGAQTNLLAFYTAVCEAFIIENQLTNVTLVGNGLGSAVSFLYAHRNPDNVKALVLFNLLSRDTVTAGPLGRLVRIMEKSATLASLLKAMAAGIKLPGFIAKYCYHFLFAPGLRPSKKIAKELTKNFQRSGQLRALLDLTANTGSFACIDRIYLSRKFPVQIFWGKQNRVLGSPASGSFFKRIPNIELNVLDEAGHLLMLEQPIAVTRIMNDFFGRLAKTQSIRQNLVIGSNPTASVREPAPSPV